MTVGELMEWLNGLPRNRMIVLSKDGEGNRFSPLAGASDEYYVAENTWSGELADALDDTGISVLVLWPVN